MTFPTRTLHSSARRSRAVYGGAQQVAGGGGPWERQRARRPLPPVTRQQLLQLWQDTLQLVQGGSGLR